MRLEHREQVTAPPERVWELLLDIPRAAQLMPGVEEVALQEDGSYTAVMKVRLGPISMNLQGRVKLEEHDWARRRAVLRLEGADRRVGGSAKATIELELAAPSEGVTLLVMNTDVTLMGKLGQFGLPLIKRKVDATVAEFARNLASHV